MSIMTKTTWGGKIYWGLAYCFRWEVHSHQYGGHGRRHIGTAVESLCGETNTNTNKPQAERKLARKGQGFSDPTPNDAPLPTRPYS